MRPVFRFRAIVLMVAALWPIGSRAANEETTARSLLRLRGAPCGDIKGTAPDGKGNFLFECTNGMIYGVIKAPEGYILVRRNSLTGKFDLF